MPYLAVIRLLMCYVYLRILQAGTLATMTLLVNCCSINDMSSRGGNSLLKYLESIRITF